MSMESSMDCMQLWYKRDRVTAGRNIELGIKMRNQVGYFNMRPFLHRSWNFFCWSHESKSGENKLYLNGKLQEVKIFDAEMEMNGSSEVYGASFSLAQEPDAFRGRYDQEQAFRGSISELNMWDYVLDTKNISDLAACKKHEKGNIISWDIDNFILYNVTETAIDDVKGFCITGEKIFVFPEQMYKADAIDLCKDHGGYLFTPRN